MKQNRHNPEDGICNLFRFHFAMEPIISSTSRLAVLPFQHIADGLRGQRSFLNVLQELGREENTV